jgi:hypothetical protein
LLRRWPRNKGHNWDLAAGLSLLFAFTQGGGINLAVIDYPNGQTKQYFTCSYLNNNEGKPWFNFHVSGGHEWILKSKDIFQVNVKLNYSPISPSTGTYIFTTGMQPDLRGNYSMSGSYIGLSIAYIFTSLSFRTEKKTQR